MRCECHMFVRKEYYPRTNEAEDSSNEIKNWSRVYLLNRRFDLGIDHLKVTDSD